MVVSSDFVTMGTGNTERRTVDCVEQLYSLEAVTVYKVVADGVATGLAIVASERPVDGAQSNVVACVLRVDKIMDDRLQMAVSDLAWTNAWGFTVTLTESLLLQPFPPSTVIVYTVVSCGEA
jgi:hypothetical protein